MQANIIKGTAQGIGRRHRSRSGGEPVERCAERKKDHSRLAIHRTGFLRQPLKAIPRKQDMDETFFDEYFTDSNFNRLLECAVHYAGLLGKTIEIPTGTIHERISMLYHHFSGILPEGQYLNFDADDGMLMWVIYYEHKWNDLTFYWMPLDFINKLSGQIKEISISFMNRFIHQNGLTMFDESFEYDYLFESATDSISCNDYEESEREEIHSLLHSYFNGEIADFLNKVYGHKPLNVPEALEKFQPASPIEAKLIECFKSGLAFISGGSIMSYEYDPDSESLPEEPEDFEPVTLDRMVRYLYALDDFVTNELEYMTNQYLRETYALHPVSYDILDPKSKLFVPGNYPERFSEWFLEMVEIAKEISSHE